MLWPENGYVGVRNKGDGSITDKLEVTRMRDGRQEPLHHEVHHSPDGLEWGYGGSGPADLALSILFDATGDKNRAWCLHQTFKRDFVAEFGDEWALTDEQVSKWLQKQTQEA